MGRPTARPLCLRHLRRRWRFEQALNADSWWQAFIDTKAIIEPVTFGVQSAGSDDAVLVSVSPGVKTSVLAGPASKADFTLAARAEQWERFFAKDPKAPYTSFVGLQVREEACYRHMSGFLFQHLMMFQLSH
jgi:hypothetical protein